MNIYLGLSKKALINVTLFTLLVIVGGVKAQEQEVLYVGTGTSAFSKRIYFPLYQDFEAETGIKIIRVKLNNVKVLDNDEAWYAYNGEPIDVINGQATSRLEKFYDEGKIADINEFWDKHHLDDSFGHLKDLVSRDGKILGLPFNVYGWQMFYLKSNVGPDFKVPETIDDLANTCTALTKKGLIPFHVAHNSAWVQMAWFEYITLRTHGLEFFNELMNGEHSYTSKEVEEVLTHWKKLIDARCFSDAYGDMDWREAIPFFFRKKFAMMLTGNTLTTYIRSDQMKEDIGYFAFPKINDIPRYETAPTNAYLVSKLSDKTAAINRFILYMAQPEIQELITHQLGCIPANKNSKPPTDPYANEISKIVLTAAGTSAFIDRILKPDFEKESRVYFQGFVKDGNIEKFMKNLEALRQKYYLKKYYLKKEMH